MLIKYKNILHKKGEVYLRIKVRPNSSRSKITEMNDDEIKIDIAAAPEKGEANAELIKLLAKGFEIGKNNVKIINGASSRIKLIKIKL
jgi:hypothetical protein